jgi:signal transduction histidine kinase/ActR/RegA family two-component response regulator
MTNQNEAIPDRTDPLAIGGIIPELEMLHCLHDQEVTLLRDTINQLLHTVTMHAEEKDRSDAFAILIKQLREANQHLLASFDAQDLQASAEAANRRQTEFLSMLAHELRNPLQPMAMANSLLTSITELHPDIARVHGVFSRQVAHMVRLVDDLLDASHVSSGKITLQLHPLLLSDVIAGAIETSQPAIDRRNQQLSVDLPVAPLVIEGDLPRLAQVFSNLLVNASKFTHEYGHIVITVRRVGGSAEISVRDDGAGVPLDIQPFIFDLFTQGFRSLDRAQGGLGIGLSLVRTITQLHAGSVDVISAGSGCGSKFVVTLPLSASLLPKDSDPAAPAGPALPCRVLLIEDNVDANDILAMLLRQDGHSVTACFDGPSGLRAGLIQPYDVVVCDIGLPGMDGYQVVSALRAALARPLPCFVATSGYCQAGEPDLASQAGFDHYLLKPILMASLASIIAAQTLRRPEAART